MLKSDVVRFESTVVDRVPIVIATTQFVLSISFAIAALHSPTLADNVWGWTSNWGQIIPALGHIHQFLPMPRLAAVHSIYIGAALLHLVATACFLFWLAYRKTSDSTFTVRPKWPLLFFAVIWLYLWWDFFFYVGDPSKPGTHASKLANGRLMAEINFALFFPLSTYLYCFVFYGLSIKSRMSTRLA